LCRTGDYTLPHVIEDAVTASPSAPQTLNQVSRATKRISSERVGNESRRSPIWNPNRMKQTSCAVCASELRSTREEILFTWGKTNTLTVNPVVHVRSYSSPLHQFLCGLNASPDDKKVEESERHECRTSESMV
jgi:hypothetical protein